MLPHHLIMNRAIFLRGYKYLVPDQVQFSIQVEFEMKQVICIICILLCISVTRAFLLPREFPKSKEPYGFEDFGFAKIFMIEKPKEIVEKTEENGSIAGSFTPRGWLKLNKAKILHNLIH